MVLLFEIHNHHTNFKMITINNDHNYFKQITPSNDSICNDNLFHFKQIIFSLFSVVK